MFSIKSDLPCGLVVRIPGFHPGGPGSIPGVGTFFYFRIVGTFLILGDASILIKPVCAYSTADDVRRKLLSNLPVGDAVEACEVTIVKVPSTKPLTRAQYKQAINYWPVTFHEDKRCVFIWQLCV